MTTDDHRQYVFSKLLLWENDEILNKLGISYLFLPKIYGHDIKINGLKTKLFEAFTHKSALPLMNRKGLRSYEQLEWLGDKVLSMYVAENIFKFSHNDSIVHYEELYKRFIKNDNLKKIFENLKLSEYVISDRNLNISKVNKIKADIIEATIGAVYLTCHKDILKKYIYKLLDSSGEVKLYTSKMKVLYKKKELSIVEKINNKLDSLF
jgi:ribonuclease-3